MPAFMCPWHPLERPTSVSDTVGLYTRGWSRATSNDSSTSCAYTSCAYTSANTSSITITTVSNPTFDDVSARLWSAYLVGRVRSCEHAALPLLPGDSLEIPFAEESLYQPSGADLLTFHMRHGSLMFRPVFSLQSLRVCGIQLRYRAQGHSSYPPLNVNTGNLAGIMH